MYNHFLLCYARTNETHVFYSIETTPRKIVEPAGKPDDTVYETSNNGGGQASHRDFLGKRE